MHAVACDLARALRKLGTAIAASNPIMTTTIIISSNVKPALWEVFIFFFKPWNKKLCIFIISPIIFTILML